MATVTALGVVAGLVMLLVAIVHQMNDTGRRWRIEDMQRDLKLRRRRAGGIGHNRKARR